MFTLVADLQCAVADEVSAVILMYHRFGEDDIPSTNTRIGQFEAQLEALTSGEYNVLPLPDIIEALRDGLPLPERTLAITIDDAYASVYTQAWPRLRAAGLPFTLFVATDPLDQRLAGHMSWDQLREMYAAGGLTVGNHGDDHAHMASRPAEQNRNSVAHATERFREELGFAPILFAYPFGEYGSELRDIVIQTGFQAAFGQHSGGIGRQSDLFALPRFPLNEAYGDMDRFLLVLDSQPLAVREVVPADNLLTTSDPNPPAFGFTVAEGMGSLAAINCYAGTKDLQVERLGERRVEVRFSQAWPKGRTRINCTIPGPDGRWRWFGTQYYVAGPDGR